MASAVPFTRDELEHWRSTLQHTQDWLHARGIAYCSCSRRTSTPSTPTRCRRRCIRVGAETRTDALVRYLRDHSTVPVLDLRPALREARTRERIYHRTDTHWNDRGAFVAYDAIIRALGVAGPPVPRAAFEAPVVPGPGSTSPACSA